MYKFALNRPITVLMGVLSLIIFGLLSYRSMPVNLFPNIDFPIVTVQTTFSGADALTVESKVTDMIEEAISGVDGIDKISSSSFEGMSVVVVQFELERDISEAANDVRDKIGALALPTGVDTPMVKKVDTGGSVINLFVSTKGANTQALMLLADEKLKPRLQRVRGVGEVNIVGFREREIRIFIDPAKLSRHHLDIATLQRIIEKENYRSSAGKLIAHDKEFIIKSRGDALSLEALGEIVIKEGVQLSDIARIEDALSDGTSYSALNDNAGVMLEIKKISGANALKIIEGVKATLPTLQSIAGETYSLTLIQDSSEKILLNLNQVKFDLVYGAILAVLIVFLFLRNLRATLLAGLAIPISIIGTFGVIDYLGYDLNKLSLIGLTLAIGIFIDDAIVVIENIAKKLEQGLGRFEATLLGVKEIAFSVLGISSMLLAVFIPIAFMDGIVGKFFNSFAMTVASGVVISYFVAILFIPAFGSRLLNHRESLFFRKTEPLFVALDRAYVFILSYLVRFKYLTIIGVVGVIFLTSPIGKNVGMDFVPMQDNSEYQVLVKADVGISLEAMKQKLIPIIEAIKADENTLDYVASIGYTDSKEIHKAKVYVKIKPVSKRKETQAQVVSRFRTLFKQMDLIISVEEVPPFNTGESNAPIQIVIKGDTLEGLEKSAKEVMAYLESIDGVVNIDSDYEAGKPEYTISILRENAKRQGIDTAQIAGILASAFSSEQKISDFEDRGKQYDITLRFDDKHRQSIEDIKTIMVLNKENRLIPLETLIEIQASTGVASINRFDRERKVMVTAYKEESLALDAVVKHINAKVPQMLAKGYSYQLVGEIERMQDTNKAFGAAVFLAVILTYLILASLYESIIQPFIIMVAMPLSFSGVIIALGLSHMNFSLFVMIGIILLLGMVGKNAVLVVDFANGAIKEGKEVNQALIEAGEKRLRPILMTTFAMIGAMVPLAFSHGAGHEANAPMALSIIGGLISSTILTLLVVPALYRILYPLDSWLRKLYERKKVS